METDISISFCVVEMTLSANFKLAKYHKQINVFSSICSIFAKFLNIPKARKY